MMKTLNEKDWQERTLEEAIEAANIRQSLYEDEHSIKAYFDKYMHADFDSAETRDMILEYFVDKMHIYNDRIMITSCFSEDNREVPYEVLDGDDDPFVKEEVVEFDCFPLSSTNKKV